MDNNFRITVDAAAVVAMLGLTAEELGPVILEQLAAVSELAKETMRENAPVGVGGEAGLKGSVGYKIVPETLTSEIKPSVGYGDAVETGSRPHWVSAAPGSPLEQWAQLKGINVYALQHSIAVKGTKPHPYVQPTYDAIAPLIGAKFAEGVGKFIKERELASL